MKINKKGFTLIELLVVIAIIGILSSVVLASLNDARGKARVAAAQGTLAGVVPGAIICLDDNAALTTPTAGVGAEAGGNALCGGTTMWPALPGGWSYGTTTSATATQTFSFTASGDDETILCDQNGCRRPTE